MKELNNISDDLIRRFVEDDISDEERNIIVSAVEEDNLLSLIPNSKNENSVVYRAEEIISIQAQQIILRDYGIFSSTEDLLNINYQNGWGIGQDNNQTNSIGKLLNYYEIQTKFVQDATIFHIIYELSLGHRLIVGINNNTLSQEKQWQIFDKKLYGSKANHLLLVIGIDTHLPDNLQIIIRDPSDDSGIKIISANEFINLWNNVGCFMLSTTVSAPQSLNKEMINFNYQIGFIQQFADYSYQEIIKKLSDEGYIQSGKNNRKQRIFLISLIIFLLIAIGAIFTWNLFTPTTMEIDIQEDLNYKIPNIPFESGTLTFSSSTKSPQTYHINPDNFTITIDKIYLKNRRNNAHILFEANGYQPIDTFIKIQKHIFLPIRRDNSLGTIFGTIIDSENSQPLENVTLRVNKIETQTNKDGYFIINIPFKEQKLEQNLKAFKEGYQMWDGTYTPSQSKGWEIVLIKNE